VIDWEWYRSWRTFNARRPRSQRPWESRRYAARHRNLAEVHKRGAEGGRKSIRRMQFESATKGSIACKSGSEAVSGPAR